jgi:hypothetical protein
VIEITVSLFELSPICQSGKTPAYLCDFDSDSSGAVDPIEKDFCKPTLGR